MGLVKEILLLRAPPFAACLIVYIHKSCRTYGAHNSMHTLPTALPWANLPLRLRRVECCEKHSVNYPSLVRG